MNRTIVYKTKNFPALSESFVLQNIVQTIRSGYDVKIVADQIFKAENAANPQLVRDFDLIAKTRRIHYPPSKLKRAIKGLWLLLRPSCMKYGIRYILHMKAIRPKYGYILQFYNQYRGHEVIHIHFADNVEPVLILKRIGYLKSSIIVTFHGYDAHNMPKGSELDKLVDEYKNVVDAITVNSSYLKQVLTDIGLPSDLIKVIPMGVDKNSFKGKIRKSIESPVKLITIGRLISLKGQEFGIRVMERLKKQGISATYTIVGQGPELANLKNLTMDLGLTDNVIFAGRLKHAEIRSSLLEHDIFLMTSVTDPDDGRMEAFGLVSIEAQSTGLPVVAFDSGGVSETIINNKTGVLVQEKNIAAMVAAILQLMQREDHYAEMSSAAVDHAIESYDLIKVNAKFEKLYDSNIH